MKKLKEIRKELLGIADIIENLLIVIDSDSATNAEYRKLAACLSYKACLLRKFIDECDDSLCDDYAEFIKKKGSDDCGDCPSQMEYYLTGR